MTTRSFAACGGFRHRTHAAFGAQATRAPRTLHPLQLDTGRGSTQAQTMGLGGLFFSPKDFQSRCAFVVGHIVSGRTQAGKARSTSKRSTGPTLGPVSADAQARRHQPLRRSVRHLLAQHECPAASGGTSSAGRTARAPRKPRGSTAQAGGVCQSRCLGCAAASGTRPVKLPVKL